MQVQDFTMTKEDANSGITIRAWMNAALGAIVTQNSGFEAPTTTYPFMWWYDTADETYYYLKQRNHDDSSWNTVFTYDVTAKQILNFATESYVDNLVDAINTALGTKADATAVNDALNTLDNNKADKATTLVGYGITDAYTPQAASTTVAGIIEIATSAEILAGDTIRAISGASLKAALNVTGDAPIFANRAKGNFYWNGSAIVINSGSINIASIVRTSPGIHVVTMTIDMPDANYTVAGSGKRSDSTADSVFGSQINSRNQFTIYTSNGGGGMNDFANISFVVS